MENCDECKKEKKKATADNPVGLTWFDNEQKWICDSCLRRKTSRSVIAIALKTD